MSARIRPRSALLCQEPHYEAFPFPPRLRREITGAVVSPREILKISDRAYRVLLDSPSAPERKKALRDACLAPKAYKLCWDLWGTEMPPSMRSTLLFEHGFIDSSVDAFIKNYKASLQFSGLLDEKNGLEEEEEPEINHQNEVSSASVQSQDGALPSVMPQNAAPAQGIEAAPSAPTIERPLLTKGAGMRQEIFTVSEGDVTIQWPERMSADSLQDFKDWLRILERKITRSSLPPQSSTQRTVDEPPLG